MAMSSINTSMFNPTYLYIKTHNTTKLKYFGKTIYDPFKYKGSGSYWTRHIKKHGYNISTEILGLYYDKETCLLAAKEFSINNNIVESPEWANLRIEELDGGDTSKTENFKKWLPRCSAENKKRRWWNNGIISIFRETSPEGFIRGRGKFNNTGAKKGAEIQKNKIWIQNGLHQIMILKTDSIPEGYAIGRTESKKKGKSNTTAIGTKWWNNSINQKMSKDCPGSDWKLGRCKGGGYGNR
jgi:hypothetical protein